MMEEKFVELLQLRYFCIVAHHQSITRAAAELLISQPALSKTIHKLEQEVGTTLFERRGKYIQLNRAGEIFYSQVRQSLSALEDGLSRLSDMSDVPTGEVHVLVQGASNFLSDLYLDFHKRYPYVHLRLSNHTQSDQLQLSDYDLTIYTTERYMPSSNSVPLLRERMVLAVPCGHPLAGRAQVALAEAASYPFIITNIYSYVMELCRMAGFTPNVRTQCDNTYTFMQLMHHDLGVSIVPEITIGAEVREGLVLVPFENPASERTVALSWNVHRYLHGAASLFRDLAIEYFAKVRRDPRALPLPEMQPDPARQKNTKEQLLWSDL